MEHTVATDGKKNLNAVAKSHFGGLRLFAAWFISVEWVGVQVRLATMMSWQSVTKRISVRLRLRIVHAKNQLGYWGS